MCPFLNGGARFSNVPCPLLWNLVATGGGFLWFDTVGTITSMHSDAPLRRITTWLAILGYTLVASGLPLPLAGIAPAAPESAIAKRLAAKDRSRPFPCMDKACGCATAEQCFTSCCCNTPAEILVWAKAHRVEPAVLVALEQRANREPHAVAKAVSAPKKPSCCSAAASRAEASCCMSKDPAADVAAGAEICSDDQSLAAVSAVPEEAPSEEQSPEQPRARTVVLRAMLACGGIVAEWCAAGAALPPPRVEVSLVMRVVDACVAADEAGECLRVSPAVPPPRVA